jgi:hypothetical protein
VILHREDAKNAKRFAFAIFAPLRCSVGSGLRGAFGKGAANGHLRWDDGFVIRVNWEHLISTNPLAVFPSINFRGTLLDRNPSQFPRDFA